MGVRSIKELCDEKGITIEELSQKCLLFKTQNKAFPSISHRLKIGR